MDSRVGQRPAHWHALPCKHNPKCPAPQCTYSSEADASKSVSINFLPHCMATYVQLKLINGRVVSGCFSAHLLLLKMTRMLCRLDPVHVERVSIRDALGGLSGLKRGGFSSLWAQVELIEPTFQVNLLFTTTPESRQSPSAPAAPFEHHFSTVCNDQQESICAATPTHECRQDVVWASFVSITRSCRVVGGCRMCCSH